MPPLGWIEPADRSAEMNTASDDAKRKRVRMALARPSLPKGTKILLTDFWSKPEVVADIGVFTGFRQLTGSCVGVSDGDAVVTLSAVQRMLATAPTKAVIPWWCFNYGRSRALAGIRGQGEGSIDSIMGQQMTEGIIDCTTPGFPVFNRDDGYALNSSIEMQWSDGNSALVTQWKEKAKAYPLGGVASLEDIDAVAASIINGYPVLNGCSNYCGSARVGSNNLALGTYDGRGGHSTTFLGYWEHEVLGPLYLYHNQWGGNTYSEDGSGKPRCSTWMLEKTAKQLFSLGGDNGETMAFSHLTYLPAQPKILDWSTI